MAKKIMLRHREFGITKTGFYGYSWTTLFCGPYPALFRSDIILFVLLIAFEYLPMIVSNSAADTGFLPKLIVTCTAIACLNVVWSFLYNKYYTLRLIERGYVLAGSEAENELAERALKIVRPNAQ